MTKRYVLDTNVYLTNYQSIYSYEDGEIIIPLKVLEEIDNTKKGKIALVTTHDKPSRLWTS